MECRFQSKEEKKKLVREFLKEYGDDLPPEALDKAELLIDHFALKCDDNNQITAAATYEPKTDWYLCTIRYLATKTSERGKGLGTEVASKVIDDAKRNEQCLVLAADITFDNKFSKRIFEELGFVEKSRFCWAKGEKPSDILHYVRFPPQDSNQC